MRNETSEDYLKKAKRFFMLFNLSEDSIEPHAISNALQRAARDKDDLHRADGDIKDKKVIHNIQQYGLAKSSWQQLKTAVRYYCQYHGLDNAMNAIDDTNMGLSRAHYKKPTKKIKTISNEQIEQINVAIQAQVERLQSKPKNWNKLNQQAQGDWTKKREASIKKYGGMVCLMTLFHLTGCRPIEAMSMKAIGNQVIYIKGAKQTNAMTNGRSRNDISEDKFNRGADRFITLPKKEYQAIITALTTLKAIGWLPAKTDDIINQAIIESGINQRSFQMLDKNEQEEIIYKYRAKQFQKYLDLAQSQFRRTSIKVLKLKKSLCFYTFRHQLASDLKGDDLYDRKEIAYLLGHISTKSLDAYGHRKSAKGKRHIDVADFNALTKIRTTHSTIRFTKKGPDKATRRMVANHKWNKPAKSRLQLVVN